MTVHGKRENHSVFYALSQCRGQLQTPTVTDHHLKWQQMGKLWDKACSWLPVNSFNSLPYGVRKHENVKVKLSLCMTWRHIKRSEGIVPLTELKPLLHGGKWSGLCSGLFSPQGNSPCYLLNMRLSRPRIQHECSAEKFLGPAVKPKIIQHVAYITLNR